MQASHGHSVACCNIPPVVAKGYEKKGSFEEIGGYKTYVTGPATASKGIVAIYDIFGYFDQTIQGADILAHADEQEHRHHEQYRVFMPDWFEGKPCPIEYYPPDTKEKQQKLRQFFATFPPHRIAGLLPEYIQALKVHCPYIQKLAIIGYCWGAKVAILGTSSPPSPSTSSLPLPVLFSTAAALHPAMLDPSDAKTLDVPFALLASKDEDANTVKEFAAAIPKGVAKHVETFPDQIHGWMAARADLQDENVKKEYERGYRVLCEFLAKHF